jgi:hypothetical protein
MRPRWFFFLSLGYRVVAFVGQPARDALPALLSAKLGGVGGSARLQERWYGTQLLLMPHSYDTSTEDVVDAVRRFSDVPVLGG